MQYHQNGHRPGDPAIIASVPNLVASRDKVDVLIVGCGPAGLTLAAQLAAFADINTRIIERKPGPIEVGQADGIACRSMEMFEAFGFADAVKKEAYWVNEVAFWRPAENSQIPLSRVERIQDVEDGLSEMPHTILSQARVHEFYLQSMRNSARRLTPDYGLTLVSLVRKDSGDHPVVATLESAEGARQAVRARFVVGCDGARSQVRQSLGYPLKGEAARQLWGVMDILAVTDFPDIRLKAAIQSASQGSMLIIPREGGYLVRLYIELDQLQVGERAADRNITASHLIEKAQAILSPFTLAVKEVAWWSSYEIGQRVCDEFDDSALIAANLQPRIFIAGDACHTHSPKAGQGMNVSMADSFNLGWKLAAVIRQQAKAKLLRSYSLERRAKAQELIDFDRDMARHFSAVPGNAVEAERFAQYFKKHGRYTAGVETRYAASLVTANTEYQSLAAGYPVGMRFHSAPVIRLADGKPLELGHELKADGRWRLIAFAPTRDGKSALQALTPLCNFLTDDATSPLRRYTPTGLDIDAVIDVRAIFQCDHRNLAIECLPDLLKPTKGRYDLIDYEKVFCAMPNPRCDIFDLRGIDRSVGALIIVRPDQYVSHVLPLWGHEPLANFFARFMG